MLRFSRQELKAVKRAPTKRFTRTRWAELTLVVLAGLGSMAGSAEIKTSRPGKTIRATGIRAAGFRAAGVRVTNVLNPHLHLTPTAVAAAEPAPVTSAPAASSPAASSPATTTTRKEHRRHIHELIVAHRHHWWHRSWSYYTWVGHHRGTGTIEGLVRGPNGQPMRMAKVVLKTPRGGGFKNVAKRHITYTNARGAFVMRGVLSGNYRVVAKAEKKRGHVETAVQTSGMSTVMIRI